MLNILLVGGTSYKETGQESGYIRKLAQHFNVTEKVVYINGVPIDVLEDVLEGQYGEKFDVVMWFPLIDNKYVKMVERAKRLAGHGIFITSKYNTIVDGAPKYTNLDIIGRALASKSNLLLELSKFDIMVKTTIWDPLGNVYCLNEQDINIVAKKLYERINQLTSFHRIPSVKVGEKEPAIYASSEHYYFLNKVKEYAEVFHNLVHAVNPTRFLGNISLRCRCERGFPSMRIDDEIYVSKRNVDKRNISIEDMVRVQYNSKEGIVEYCGNEKPSVDTPCQLQLYKSLNSVNYILHSHCYINDAPFTENKLPCGCIEEVVGIYGLYSEGHKYINLKGHGSIVLGDCWQDFIDIPYIARPMPEL